MKKVIIAFTLSILLITSHTTTVTADKPTQDTEELRLQDMLMNMLTPYIREDLNKFYYPKILKDFSPQVSPWLIEVIETRRVNGFRGLVLEITFEIEPDDGGHHVAVGKDKMTYQISYGPEVKLVNHTHIKTYNYPTNSQSPFDYNKLPRLYKNVLKRQF
ncbi:DUF3888 domain-containing protein [Neobacillus sp. PS3-34]|uniref:DUF3888 domain-containing protein n=1 Tax=Neobacillus sp. PS3-34 TaxID=3070678 RepID=UPI0027DEF71C|nr:DUF3888 domain-containing protein [Neobacillus sp. PS3-34]WML50234.1 DUF3888 domain-containing protein [Neobacillus sp. PS3-34]